MKYRISYHVEGNVAVVVEADSEEAALEAAGRQVEENVDALNIQFTDWDLPELEVLDA